VTMIRDIPVSPDVFLQGIIDHWDVSYAHSFILQLAAEWGYESFATELATKLFQQAGYEVEVTGGEEDGDDDGWIPWEGGERPADPDTRVLVRYRDGFYNYDGARAGFFEWQHFGSTDDIIAYKVVG